MAKKSAEIIILLMILAAAILLALNASQFFLRLDLTGSKAFTISPVSRKLFQEIPERVFITYYVSDKLKSLYPFPAQVEDLLNEYAAYSRGKISVSVRDPARAGETSVAESLGVYPQQIEVVEKDEQTVAVVYTGIVIQYLDRSETLPLVARLESLEYELTSKVRKVVSNEVRKLGLLVGDAGKQLRQDYERLVGRLGADFAVEEIERGKDIPQDLSLLFVLGNQDLSEFDLYPIDQYLMKGGKALFAVEGVKLDLLRGMAASKLEQSPLLDLLESYGVKVKRELVLDKYCKNFRIPRQIFGQIMWELREKYPLWITVADQFTAKDNPITARFSGLDLYWASPLELVEKPGVSGKALVKTTPEAWTMADRFETLPERVSMLSYGKQESTGQYTLAATLTGSLSSFFKGKAIPTREGEKRDWAQSVAESKETRLIVIGDSDFASGLYMYTDAEYNQEFLSNCAQWLGNAEDLLAIKTRSSRDLRLNKIQDPVQRLGFALFTQLLTVVLVPLLVIGFGIARMLVRRKKSLTVGQEG